MTIEIGHILKFFKKTKESDMNYSSKSDTPGTLENGVKIGLGGKDKNYTKHNNLLRDNRGECYRVGDDGKLWAFEFGSYSERATDYTIKDIIGGKTSDGKTFTNDLGGKERAAKDYMDRFYKFELKDGWNLGPWEKAGITSSYKLPEDRVAFNKVAQFQMPKYFKEYNPSVMINQDHKEEDIPKLIQESGKKEMINKIKDMADV